MPVVRLYTDELEKMVGKDIDEIIEVLPMLGSDIERIEKDHIDVEFFPNRPDLYSVEGVARALRGIFELETGLKEYEVKDSSEKLTIDPSVKKVRPNIVGAIVREIRLTDEVIRSLVELQEDLHWTIGRNRRKVAIGIHDLSVIEFPLKYTTVDENFEFVPLDYSYEMSIKEILEYHKKGIEFGFILEGSDKYPIIIDANEGVLSMPPIINCERTRLTEDTSDLFIDVTGLDDSVEKALNILVSMLADRGGKLESIVIVDGEKTFRTPDLSPRDLEVEFDEISSLLGTELAREDIISSLEKMRYGVTPGNALKVKVPAYRADIMHPWDIIEDIAIGYGYDRLKPIYPDVSTIGATHPWEDLKELVREIMTGLGFLEILTFTLTSPEVQYVKMRRSEKDYTDVMHPISEDYTILRTDLLPNLLETLSINKHNPLPQKLFEVGEVVISDHNHLRLAGVITHSNANFAEIRSVIQRLMAEINVGYEIEEGHDSAFISGRCGAISISDRPLGIFGEIHPMVLENFELVNPVVGFEIDLETVLDITGTNGDLLF
jgi:phenylalanyl-tRNA synthetase beta chain